MARLRDDDRLATRCVHAGWEPDEVGAVNPPIQLSTTFVQPDVAKPLRHDYSRAGNPTREVLETAIADLEGGATGHAFASGLSAFDALLRTLEPGDHVLCAEDAYGGSIRLLDRIAVRQGLTTTYVDTQDAANVRAAMQQRTRLVILETPTNPLLRVSDIAAVAETAHEGGARLVVDSTFMSPALQNPLRHGADAVFHSATKYIGGHSDVLAGLVVCADEDWGEQVRFLQLAVGAVLPPFDCYLLLRGLKTLHLRMERQSQSALEIARRLIGHGATSVYHPGLPEHPGHDVHMRQARGGGGMVSFDAGSAKKARKLVRATRLWQLAESLGAVESLIQVPAAMTHASVPKAMRQRTGLTDGLVRLSVGVEDVEDLWEDLEQALG